MQTFRPLTLTFATILMLNGPFACAYDFSWDTMMLASMKMDKHFDYDTHVDASSCSGVVASCPPLQLTKQEPSNCSRSSTHAGQTHCR